MCYYIHFEITGDLCNLIGSRQCDLFTNHTIFSLNYICSGILELNYFDNYKYPGPRKKNGRPS